MRLLWISLGTIYGLRTHFVYKKRKTFYISKNAQVFALFAYIFLNMKCPSGL